MLITHNQVEIDKNTQLTFETYHNRVEAEVTRWDGENFISLARTNCFAYDTVGEVLAGVLYDAGYDNGIEIIDSLGLYEYPEDED